MLNLPRLARGLALLGGVASAAAACDMDIPNLNQPDRERALSEPGDVEALVAGTFSVFFRAMHDRGFAVNFIPAVATEQTTTTPTGRAVQAVREPRGPYNIDLSLGSTGEWGPREVWWDLNEVASGAYDGLRLMNEGMTFGEGGQDTTPRARAFAKLMQGLAWGYQAMIYDQAVIVPEEEPLRSDIGAQGRESLVARAEALGIALAQLDQAVALAGQHDLTFPTFPGSRLWFGLSEPMGSAKFIELANTIAARLLVLSARTPAERSQVDWNRVLQHTANGLTSDFEVTLASGFRSSTLYSRIQNNPVGCGSCLRMDYRLIGLADVSGAYQNWIGRPYGERDRFDIVTPDRRITGLTPTSDGAYLRYRTDNNGFSAEFPLFSAYQWARHAHRMNNAGTASNQGTAIMASVDENNLLRAEALLHTGDLAGAAALINLTRTRSHTLPDGITYPGLPPVTAAGVPDSGDCVPRTDAGTCGDLLVALRYERMLELVGLDTVRGWADGRGFGILPDGTWLMLPPAPEDLRLFEVPVYTFGGVGSEWGAVYAPVTLN